MVGWSRSRLDGLIEGLMGCGDVQVAGGSVARDQPWSFDLGLGLGN